MDEERGVAVRASASGAGPGAIQGPFRRTSRGGIWPLKQVSWMEGIAGCGHWRTHDGAEVDLVIERVDGGIVGIEVKAGSRLQDKDLTGHKILKGEFVDPGRVRNPSPGLEVSTTARAAFSATRAVGTPASRTRRVEFEDAASLPPTLARRRPARTTPPPCPSRGSRRCGGRLRPTRCRA